MNRQDISPVTAAGPGANHSRALQAIPRGYWAKVPQTALLVQTETGSYVYWRYMAWQWFMYYWRILIKLMLIFELVGKRGVTRLRVTLPGDSAALLKYRISKTIARLATWNLRKIWCCLPGIRSGKNWWYCITIPVVREFTCCLYKFPCCGPKRILFLDFDPHYTNSSLFTVTLA